MLIYLEYFLTWVFFMAIIAAIALLSPKLAKLIDKKFKKYNKDEKEALLEFPTDEAKSETAPPEKPDDEQ